MRIYVWNGYIHGLLWLGGRMCHNQQWGEPLACWLISRSPKIPYQSKQCAFGWIFQWVLKGKSARHSQFSNSMTKRQDIENPSWAPLRNGAHLSEFVFQKSQAMASDFCGIRTWSILFLPQCFLFCDYFTKTTEITPKSSELIVRGRKSQVSVDKMYYSLSMIRFLIKNWLYIVLWFHFMTGVSCYMVQLLWYNWWYT